MPELPEVETTRRGLAPLIVGKSILSLNVRDRRLRWPIAKNLHTRMESQTIDSIDRRGKYLLINVSTGSLIVHLGMSGSLRFLNQAAQASKHDHVDINFVDGGCLRYNDPRRFGSMHFAAEPHRHRLLRNLGPEPLSDDFTEAHLWRSCQNRRSAIKSVIMNSAVVVGVGNIYANEALFGAGIHPGRAAGRISRRRLGRLVESVRSVLEAALLSGGTTLRDFVGGDGRPGYFRQSLSVYARAGEPCKECGSPIRRRVLGQRATYYCSHCQR